MPRWSRSRCAASRIDSRERAFRAWRPSSGSGGAGERGADGENGEDGLVLERAWLLGMADPDLTAPTALVTSWATYIMAIMREGPLPAGDPGSVIDGKYRVERTLGVGGMGRVVLAKHLEMERHVAIKLVSDRTDAELGERLLREARAASRVAGEHVARVHDVGRLADGTPYLVMEYLVGRDLAAVVAEGRVAPSSAAIWVRQACEGIAEAHAAGIIHRDLKPANLFLTQRADGSPCVKVLDFGIARTLDLAHPKLTADSTIIGSPAYMAPEQLTGKPADARTDVWSLGVVLYELLTGRLPYPEPSVAEQYARIAQGPPDAPRSVDGSIPSALSDVVMRCLARDPGRRFADARALGAALEPFAERTERYGFSTEPQTLVRAPAAKSLRMPLALGTGAGLLAVGIVVFVALHATSPDPHDESRGMESESRSVSASGAPLVTATTTELGAPLAPVVLASATASVKAAPRPTAAPHPTNPASPTAPATHAASTSKPTPSASSDPFAHRTF